MLAALPPRWLPALALLVAQARLFAPGRRRLALEQVTHALGRAWTGPEARRLIAAAEALRAEAQLRAQHPRDGTLAGLRAALRKPPWAPEAPPPLLLTARLGGAGLAAALLEGGPVPCQLLDTPPERAEGTAWLPWMGRITAVQEGPVVAALRAGRGVRLMLVLPDARGRAALWISPDLIPQDGSPPPAAARQAVQQALAALEVLVRAAPELLDWAWPRWALRPEREVAGHALSSRLAPWLSARRPGRRLGRRAR